MQAQSSKKREIFVLDESDEEPEKKVKVEDELAADEADALREKLVKLEEQNKTMVRSVRIAKRRAENAELQLDQMHEIVAGRNELEIRLVEISQHLEEAKRKAEESKEREREFEREREAWGIEKDVLNLQKNEWNIARDRLTNENRNLVDKKNELKRILKAAREKMETDQSKINELSGKVAEYEKAQQQVQYPLHDRAVIPMDRAVAEIRAKFDQCKAMRNFKEYLDVGKNTALECGTCGVKVLKLEVIYHFLSPAHITKTKAQGGAISLHAMLFWQNALQQACVDAAAAAAQKKKNAAGASHVPKSETQARDNSEADGDE